MCVPHRQYNTRAESSPDKSALPVDITYISKHIVFTRNQLIKIGGQLRSIIVRVIKQYFVTEAGKCGSDRANENTHICKDVLPYIVNFPQWVL